MEAVHKFLDVFVNERVHLDVVHPLFVLRLCGKLAVDQKVRDFEVGALLGKLFDRIPAVPQDALVPVDIGDPALAGGGVQKRRIVRHHPEIVVSYLYLPEVGGVDRVVFDRDHVLLSGPVVLDRECVSAVRGLGDLCRLVER